MSVTELGGICLVVGVLFFILGRWPKAQVILGFIGVCCLGGGLLGTILTKAALFVSHLTDTVTGKVFGAAIPGVLVIILGIVVLHDLSRQGTTSRRTFFAGLALAACLVAGVSSFQALNNVPAGVRSGVGNASTVGG
jgi:hypothetical protein